MSKEHVHDHPSDRRRHRKARRARSCRAGVCRCRSRHRFGLDVVSRHSASEPTCKSSLWESDAGRQTRTTIAAWSAIVAGSAFVFFAMCCANSLLSGSILGLALGCYFRLHRPNTRRVVSALTCSTLLMSLVAVFDVRVVRTLWPTERGVTAANVLVARLPWSDVNRGDIVAWRLDATGPARVAIDRVLAMPGEVLNVHDGTTIANAGDDESSVEPILRTRTTWDFTLSLDQREFGVIPSTIAWRPAGPEPQLAESLFLTRYSRVSSDQIIGHVLLVQNAWGLWVTP